MECRITSWVEKEVNEKRDNMVLGQGTLQLIIASLLRTSSKKYGTFRVGNPFVSLLISKKLSTLFLEINFGEELKSLESQVNTKLLCINFMRK